MKTKHARTNGSKRVQFKTTGLSKTEQSHFNETNINKIVSKYRRTGLFPHRTDRPRYGDFTGVTDFHEANNRIKKAEQDFMLLPSDIRTKFKNDPGKLVEFINNPENEVEAAELGLIPHIAKVKNTEEKPATEATEAVKTDVTKPPETSEGG